MSKQKCNSSYEYGYIVMDTGRIREKKDPPIKFYVSGKEVGLSNYG